jgi:hypothetical protein
VVPVAPVVPLLPLAETDGLLLFAVVPIPFGDLVAAMPAPHGRLPIVGLLLLRLRMPPLELGVLVPGDVLDVPVPDAPAPEDPMLPGKVGRPSSFSLP